MDKQNLIHISTGAARNNLTNTKLTSFCEQSLTHSVMSDDLTGSR